MLLRSKRTGEAAPKIEVYTLDDVPAAKQKSMIAGLSPRNSHRRAAPEIWFLSGDVTEGEPDGVGRVTSAIVKIMLGNTVAYNEFDGFGTRSHRLTWPTDDEREDAAHTLAGFYGSAFQITVANARIGMMRDPQESADRLITATNEDLAAIGSGYELLRAETLDDESSR